MAAAATASIPIAMKWSVLTSSTCRNIMYRRQHSFCLAGARRIGALHSLRLPHSSSTHRRTLADTTATTTKKDSKTATNLLAKAGLPFVLFSVLASWVVSNALDGKLKEQELSQGKSSVSLRQAKLKEEHDDMMERLNKIVATDFDNTKRIKRPNEILEERRLERERRNKWYRRWWRAIKGDSEST